MGNNKTSSQLSKFLSYVLGRRPDEFGLVPDADGFVKIIDLLKAVHEEEGWRHVRRALIDAIIITLPDPLIEIQDDRIRAKDRTQLGGRVLAESPPRLLYACVTRKSYPFVKEEGIRPTAHSQVVLSLDQTLSMRIGSRRGGEPVMLTINTQNAVDKGAVFYQSGELLFLSDFIPPGTFAGPLLPKEKEEPKKRSKPVEQKTQYTPGSFELKLDPEKSHEKKRKDISWHKDRKRARKEKQKRWEM